MLQLRLLGSVDLLDAGREVESVLRRPKRVALLTYLAVARPRGFQRRDALLALLWPDLDQSHARNALRQAVHYLRHALGHDVICARGEEELGLDARTVSCDVTLFEQRLDAGGLEPALALYRGDFLSGFHVSETAEFEHWLDQERQHLRKRATAAALSLADAAERHGNLTDAARWAGRAMETSPYAESVVRRLLTLLDRAGDRAEALRAYKEFARRLDADLGAAPSPETRVVVERIRARAEPRLHEAEESGPRATPVPHVATRRVPVRRRLAGAIGLVALAIAAVVMVPHRDRADARGPSVGVAVLPFHVVGPGLELWREGMVDLLSADLDGAGGIRKIDPRAILGRWRADLGDVADPADRRAALRVAQTLGASYGVVGSAVTIGGAVRLTAEIYALPSERLVGTAVVEGSPDSVFALVDRLSVELLRAGLIEESAERPPVDLRRVTTASLPALKAYLLAEATLRRGRYRDADGLFRRAIAADSTFALAYERQAMSLPYWDDVDAANALVEQALRYSERLAPRQRQLLHAFSFYLRGQADDAERLYREVLTAGSEDADAWSQLGNLLIMHNPLRGRPSAEGHEPLLRAAELDPEHWFPRLGLSYLAALDQNYEQSKRFLAAMPLQYDYALFPQTVFAFIDDNAAAQERQVRLFGTVPTDVVLSGARYVAVLAHDVDGAMRIVRLLTGPSREREVQAVGYAALAHLELARGRLRATQAALDSVATRDADLALTYRALFAALPFLPADTVELRELAGALGRWVPRAATARPSQSRAIALHDNLRPTFRIYLLGLLSARRRDKAAAERYAEELTRLEPTLESGTLLADLANSLRAQAAWAGGRPGPALQALEATRRETRVDKFAFSPFYSEALERFSWGELLRELGRDRDALDWYGSLDEYSVYDFVYAAPAYLRRAEIYERLGEREAARREYTRFVKLWNDCEPELRAVWERGRQALARLDNEVGR